jgi:hypothetical protein
VTGRAHLRIALVALAAGAAIAGCGASTTQNPGQLALINNDSSWIPGQVPLSGNDAYRTIAARAIAEANVRQARRDLELARIAAARVAAERRARAEILRRYEEARRRAEAAYKKALRDAARQRRIQARKLAALRRKRARELAALRRKLQVKPGQECSLPEVAVHFTCRKGMTPLPKPLPRK